MKSEIVSFAAGIVVGAVLGTLISEEDKKRFYKALNRQVVKLREEHEGPFRDGIEKVKKLVETYTR
ncbi:MAG: hypothetical protein AAFP93_01180 [Bacteroidota bacterium]